jgi:hypothetical protein
MADRFVNITHPDGRTVAVLPKDFEKGADGDYKGFRITGYEDGTPYDGPKTSAAITKAQDAPSKPEKGGE